MASKLGTILRWLAGVCLTASVGMVILGESLLKKNLQTETFIYYWLVCIVLTFLTMVTALADFWLVRRRMRREQKELIADALRAIAKVSGDIDLREWEKLDV